jgi:hypothetical protein
MEVPTTPPLDFDHHPGDETPTKHKEAIRQLYGFAKVPIEDIMARYKLGKATINRVLTLPWRTHFVGPEQLFFRGNTKTSKLVYM